MVFKGSRYTPKKTSALKVKKDEKILVYYRHDYQMPEYRYFACSSKQQGIFRPRFGMTHGWVWGTVSDDFDEATDFKHSGRNDDGVKISYDWEMWYNHRGMKLDDLKDVILPENIKIPEEPRIRDNAFCNEVPSVGPVVPDVGVLVFRWGGINTPTVPDQWGASGPPISDNFINMLLAALGTRDKTCEVWTVWVESSQDLKQFADSAHLVLAKTHPLMRCRKVVASYHLYPTNFQEFSHPFLETGEDNGAGFFEQQDVFNTMRSVEMCGIETLFPHPSNLYYLLVSKAWTNLMCMDERYCIPASVGCPRAIIDDSTCPKRIMQALERIKSARTEKLPGSGNHGGVAKLGFSWEALDVKRWKDHDGLVTVLDQLNGHVYIDENLTGQSHFNDVILVQEFILHKVELRCYVINGVVEKFAWTKFLTVNDDSDFKDFKQIDNEKDVIRDFFDGKKENMEKAKEEARTLIKRWQVWLEAQVCDSIPAVRFDFFVCEEGLVTAEICECGFSMLYDDVLPEKVFKSLADKVRTPIRSSTTTS